MKINSRSLIEGLSYALDVAEKSYLSHSKHVAYISTKIAMELGLSEQCQEDLYYAALLHDIGRSNTYLIEEHCIIGRDILLELPIHNEIAEYVYWHHEFYDGSGAFKLAGEQIQLPAQIICISDLFDRNFGGITELNLNVMKEIETWHNNIQELFNPKVLSAFRKLIKKEYVVLDYFSHEFNSMLAKTINVKGMDLGYEDVVKFAHAFSKIIDRRSHFTYEHSQGVADLVNKITKLLGYDNEIQSEMYIAALLHDIGKLVISNDIIDKNGKLSVEERFEINKHTYFTRWILEQIQGFQDITNYAANHHEKLNGNGYPLHLAGEQIGELDRIMAISDIYQALTEDRPYRNKMPKEKVWSIIDEMVAKDELDEELVKKFKVILWKEVIL